MIRLLKIILMINLFIFSRVSISKLIGNRARRDILGKIEINNKRLVNIRLIKFLIIFLLVFLITLLNGYNISFSVIFGVIAVGVLKGMDVIKKEAQKKEILLDLLNLSECLRVQISSQIPLGNALRTVSKLCKNREFSLLVNNIYLEYELSKFVIVDSGKVLVNRFNYPEMRIFISALNQQIQGTSAIEAFDNLISILREKYIEFLEDSTKSKMAIMTMGVFFIVLNIAAIGIYPVAIEAFDAMNMMLK